MVDGGWSKRSHKHSYNANSGVGVIFGAATKALLFIGVRNKYCSICAINNRNEKPIPTHQRYRDWSGSSTSMEANIILEGFRQSEEMHGLWYLWLIGDGDSSVYHSVVMGVPSYGRDITKVECANHAVKCYRNRLEALCYEKSDYRGKHGLSSAMMKRITHGARCAIKIGWLQKQLNLSRTELPTSQKSSCLLGVKWMGANITIAYNRDHFSIGQWQLLSVCNLVQGGQHQF